MFDIYLNLFIASFDLEKNRRCIVSTSENSFNFPSLLLTKNFESIDLALSELFEQHVDLGYGWINTLLVDVSKKDNVLQITYICKIPPGTELKNAYYISSNLCVTNSIARKAMAYV